MQDDVKIGDIIHIKETACRADKADGGSCSGCFMENKPCIGIAPACIGFATGTQIIFRELKECPAGSNCHATC